MRRRRTSGLLAAGLCALALVVPGRAHAFVLNWFDGGGLVGGRAIGFIWDGGLGGPDTRAFIWEGGRPVEVTLDCAEFVPASRVSPSLGGELFASGPGSDGNAYALRALDAGPARLGGDAVGWIISGGRDALGPRCRAADLGLARLQGDFVSGHANI